MSYTVRLINTGHTFEAIEQETLLEAALRDGLNIKYNCASGTCGECKAQLIEGELGEVEFHDYKMTEAEKLNGFFLTCRAHPGSDMVIDAVEAQGSDDIPRQWVDGRLTRVKPFDENYLQFQVRTPRTKTLRFLAGQSVTLHFQDLPPVTLPIASCPCNGMILEFHLHRDRGAPFSEFMFSAPRTPQMVGIEGPYGDFILDDDGSRPLIMVAVESDFAPVKSLIEHAINLDWESTIELYWIIGRDGGHYMERYCRSWQDVLDDLRYHAITLEDTDNPDSYQTLLTDLRQSMQTLGRGDVYLAGPEPIGQYLAEQLQSEPGDFRIYSLARD